MKYIARTLGLGWFALLVSTSCNPPGTAQQNQPVPDRFALPPNATADELIVFIDGLLSFEPATRAEMQVHQQHARNAILQASNRVLELETDKSSANYIKAFSLKLQGDIGTISSKSPRQQRELLASISGYFADKGSLDAGDLSLAEKLAGAIESIGNAESQAVAAEAYLTFAKTFQGLSPMATYFEGSHRRLTLVGKEFELTGTDLHGNEIDVAQWKDHVVLVDFWATWCGPCVAEIPNVRKLYDRYKGHGFVVVGISLDQKLSALQNFIKDNKIPWPTIAASIGDGNEAVAHYGIMTIPQMIVIGRDGKVLATGVRGQELTQIVQDQFGADDKEG